VANKHSGGGAGGGHRNNTNNQVITIMLYPKMSLQMEHWPRYGFVNRKHCSRITNYFIHTINSDMRM